MCGAMTQISWYEKLRRLNPKLKVCQFENSTHLPGIYYVDEREGIVDICATDIVWVPALPKYDSRGYMVKVVTGALFTFCSNLN